MKRVWRGPAVFIAALSVMLTGCSSSGSTAGPNSGSNSGSSDGNADPLHFILGVPLSMPGLGSNAETSKVAAQAGVAYINAHGGVLGHPVDLTVEDTAGNPTTAVTKLNSDINSGKKFIYLASGPSTVTSALLPILTRNKVMSFNIAPTADSGDPSTNPYNFDLAPSTENFAAAFPAYIKSHGGHSVGILHGDDAYGDPLAAAIAAACKQGGLKVTGNESFSDTALDLTSELENLQSTHPDFLVLQALGSSAGYALKGLQQIGWQIPVLGDAGVGTSSVVNQPPPTGMMGTPNENNLKIEVFASTVSRPKSQQPAGLNAMIAAMARQGKITTSLILAYMYDAVILGSRAAISAKSTVDASAISNALLQEKPGSAPTGVFPAYNFSTDSHGPNEPPSAFAFTKPTELTNGQFGASS